MPPLPGDTVYLLNNLGDVNPETNQHVVCPAGLKGTVRGEFFEYGSVKIRIDVPDSPGQKSLCCLAVDFHTFWCAAPPKPMRDRFERVLDDIA